MKRYLLFFLTLFVVFSLFRPPSAQAGTCTSTISPDTILADTTTTITATYTVPENGGWYFPKPSSISDVGALNNIANFVPVPTEPNFLELYPWENSYPNSAGVYTLQFDINISAPTDIQMKILNTTSSNYICELTNILNIKNSTTPTPLLVPLIKQTNSFWKSLVYDSAKKWSPNDPTIASWGCALTSAVMVLNYYNIVKLPDTSFITPGTLNKWLISQNDGYLGNGLVNWIAISRLSKIAKMSGNNPNFSFDALEFDRKGENNTNQLASDLQLGQPDILEEPGHYVVAKGIQEGTFLINDPLFSYSTLSEGYNNNFKSLNRYIPSHTDLSYFLVVGSKNQNLQMIDDNEDQVSDSFIQDSLHNEDNVNQKSGEPISELLYKNPSTGDYSLKVFSLNPSLYTVNIYLYDNNGEPAIKTLTGVSSIKPDIFFFSYNHENHSNSAVQKKVDFDSVIDDLNEGISLKKIDKILGNSLITIIKTVQKSSSKNKSVSKTTLKVGQTILKSTKPILLSKEMYAILNDDFTYLIKAL